MTTTRINSIKYNLNTLEGQININAVIQNYYKALSELMIVDVGMGSGGGFGVAATVLGGFWTLGLISAALEFVTYQFLRNSRNNAYQDTIEQLKEIYAICIKQGAKVTSDPLFLKVACILAPCLSNTEGEKLLYTEELQDDFNLLSADFKKILASAPHNIKLTPPPKPQPSYIAQLGGAFFGATADLKQEPLKETKTTTVENNSIMETVNTAHLWRLFYGSKPRGTAPAKPSVIEKAISSAEKVHSLSKLI